MEIIRQDWEFIVEKIKDGKAHELSDGDTLYLAASTKGGKGGNPRSQPFSKIKAKSRAFTLRQTYLNHVIGVLSGKANKKYGRIISDPRLLRKRKTLEEIVVDKFKRFYGMSVDEIIESVGTPSLNAKAKNFAAQLTKAVLDISLDKQIEEFDKAGIITKTVRLEPNELPEQSVSFPAFKYTELIGETWGESDFKKYLDAKFLFVFFQYDGEKDDPNRLLILKKVMFWNMPDADVYKAKKVWERTVELVKQGRIVKGYDKSGNRKTHFPGKTENSVAHVRPHGSTAKDTYPLPVPDNFTGAKVYSKHCFWINNDYVRDNIYRHRK